MAEEDTLPKLLLRNKEKWGHKQVAMRKKDFGIWWEYSWEDSYQNVKHVSLGLISLGFKAGDKIAIIGDNDPQWFWIALAAQAAGGVAVGILTDCISPEVKNIVEHSESTFVAAKDQEQVDKVLETRSELPHLKRVVFWDRKGMYSYKDPILIQWKELTELGKEYEKQHPGAFEENVAGGRGSDISNLFYTSGTTGLPKGVMWTHASMIAAGEALLDLAPTSNKDDMLSFIPAATNAENVFSLVTHLLNGRKLNFPEQPETAQANLREISPAIIVSTPRIYEGIISLIRVKIGDAGFLKRSCYQLLLPVGYRVADFSFKGEKPNVFWRLLYGFASAVIFRPLRDKVGLLKTRTLFSGGSITAPEVFRFLGAMGISVRELYGATEDGFVCAQRLDDAALGTLGKPLPGVTVRISDGGEIMISGGLVFSGYYKNIEATEKVLKGGWFHTGDGGYVSEYGDLVFMDRLSELAQLAGGFRYAPQYIESRLRFSPYIKDAMVTAGKDKAYIAALININLDNVGSWAERHRISYTTYVDLSQKAEVAELVQKDLSDLNESLPEPIRIRKYVLLHKEFDPDEAELTRTRKLRRTFVEQRYQELIEAIYLNKEEMIVQAAIRYRDGRTATAATSLKIRPVG